MKHLWLARLLSSVGIPLWLSGQVGMSIAVRAQAIPGSAVTSNQVLLANQSTVAEGICLEQLGSAIDAIAHQPALARSRWGILVQTLAATETDRRILYAREAQQYFIPASNAKLLTSAAVLRQLGPQFRIRTSIYQLSSLPQATVLSVVGRGDPSLTNADLQDLAQQLHRQGIRQIDQLIINDQYFRGATVHPHWEWEDVQAGYGAPVNSLILNQNEMGLTLLPQALGRPLKVVWDRSIDGLQWQIENNSITVATSEPEFIEVGRDFSRPILRVSGQLRMGSQPETVSVAIPNPTQYFTQQFRRALSVAGITVVRTTLATKLMAEAAPELAFVESPPLSELLIEVNQTSNNLYAESLLKQLGTRPNPDGSDDATTAGIEALETTLATLDVPPDSYALADGSGLSRHNLVSPEAVVRTLQAMAYVPEANIYRASLAVAGTNGTLRHRFRQTPLQGNLKGKTGTLSGTVALSGYLSPLQHPTLVFSIFVNQSEQRVRTIRRAVDRVVLLLNRLRDC
ncbi:MAG: D-alanyl-D-alanine carboxypeptidase/D-alanyl-D-alanine-endopeptidase [Cyanothece sp. SIO1E1]|nr:D-alanyl-D-alanine carboxypeptidase/D-alanyl-D-alanine-endopeptidase [Cyanothece sp. SIO1E1]